MEGNGDWGKMEENGGKRWGMGGNGGKWVGGMGGEMGHSTRDGGCGGLWQDVVEENGTKMEQK